MAAEIGTWDYIVVGAGSAGSAVAARLSEDGRASVLLLEAGPPDRNPWIHVPIGYAKTFRDPAVNWMYETEPEPHLGNRRIYWPRGKVLGGSSSINGLIYIRGVPLDFDHWRQLGCTGWGFDDVLPFFRRAEGNVRGDDDLHGGDGPLAVDEGRWRNPLSEAYVRAAQEAGLPRNDDFNGRDQEGVGYYQLTERDGRRCSAARAYLAPARRRPNLRIVTGALAERIDLADGRATGVTWLAGTERRSARAAREVVLCGGAINSPQLLMLSGIGPADHLRRHGIAVAHDLPGVGGNLHDHLQVRTMYRSAAAGTMNDAVASLFGKARMGLEYVIGRRGLLTVGAGVVGVFARTEPGLEAPDVQIHFIPFTTDKMGTGLHAFPGFSTTVNQSRPVSRGRLTLRSADPREAPAMLANYLAEEADRRTTLAGIRLLRRIAGQPAMRPWVAEELAPGPGAVTDQDLMDFARDAGNTIYHPAGTCRMGSDHDRLAVCDPELRVRGVAGLRVADASIMPQVVSGNTNAAAIMIGEKCAAMVKAAAA